MSETTSLQKDPRSSNQRFWFYDPGEISTISLEPLLEPSGRQGGFTTILVDPTGATDARWQEALPGGTRTATWDDLPGPGSDLDRLTRFLESECAQAQSRGEPGLLVAAEITRLLVEPASPANFTTRINQLFQDEFYQACWLVDGTRLPALALIQLAASLTAPQVGPWILPEVPPIPAHLLLQGPETGQAVYTWLREQARASTVSGVSSASDRFFEHIFNQIYQFVGALLPDGTLIEVNQAALDFGGLRREDVVGRPFWEAPWWPLSGKTRTDLRAAVRRAAQGEVVHYEIKLPHQPGQAADGRTIDFSIRPVKDPAGQVTLLIPEGRDITEKSELQRLAEEREKLLQRVINHAPVSIFLVDRQGIIQMAVGRGRQGLKPEHRDNAGQPIEKVYADHPEIIQYVRRALGGESFSAVVEIDRQVFDTSFTPYLDENNQVIGVLGVATNTTEHRAAEKALDSSRARFQTIFEESGMGIAVEDLDGRVLVANPAFREMLGFSQEEIRNRRFADFTHPADLHHNMTLYREMTAGRRESFRIEKRYIRKDGRSLWGRLSTSLIRDAAGSPEAVIVMVEDITAQREMMAELQEVQRRLLAGREGERLSLAQEIHDGPLQELYALSYQTRELENYLDSEEGAIQLASIQANLQQLARSLRSLSIELRPPALAPFGLEKAILSHAENFEVSHPEIKVHLDLMPDGQTLPEQVRMALFRIYQELLNNVVRHGNATQVSVRLALTPDLVELSLSDNGAGFVVPSQWLKLAREGHLGLIGARERAESVGGTLEIQSAPGKGTTVTASAPRGALDESLRIETAQYNK